MPLPPPKNKGGAPAGNRNAAEAAAFKKAVQARLIRLREGGLKIGKIVKVANGAITDSSILDILGCKRVPIAVYRVLSAALDQCENE